MGRNEGGGGGGAGGRKLKVAGGAAAPVEPPGWESPIGPPGLTYQDLNGNPTGMDAWFAAQTQGVKIKVAERNALKYYTSNGYSQLNALLRGVEPGSSGTPLTPARRAQMEAIYGAQIAALTALTNRTTLGQPTVLYRSFARRKGHYLNVGDVIDDPAFQSTSLNPLTTFGSHKGAKYQVQMRIEAGPEIRGVGVKHWSTMPGEQEVVLAPGTRYRVVQRLHHTSSGTLEITVAPFQD